MKPQLTKHKTAHKKGSSLNNDKSISTKKRSVKKKTGGFVVLSKREVEANRCKAYSYIM